MRYHLLWAGLLVGGWASTGLAAGELTARQAADNIGKVATVCGSVVSTNYAVRTKGKPTFLNLDEPYPKQIFTILIWDTDRPKFGSPEASLKGKRVCATGRIEGYKGKPEIVVTQPGQIVVR